MPSSEGIRTFLLTGGCRQGGDFNSGVYRVKLKIGAFSKIPGACYFLIDACYFFLGAFP